MIPPDIFSDPYLSPSDKRVLYVGLLSLAEDSGCLFWDARTIRGAVLVHDDVSIERVEHLMQELESEGRVWTYESAGRTWAYLPEFPQWQKSLTRWQAPNTVPLPPGVTYAPSTTANNTGSGRYSWPETMIAMRGGVQVNVIESMESNQSKEPAPEPPATRERPATDTAEQSADEDWKDFLKAYPKQSATGDAERFAALSPEQRRQAISAAHQYAATDKTTEARFRKSVSTFLGDPIQLEVLAECWDAKTAKEAERLERCANATPERELTAEEWDHSRTLAAESVKLLEQMTGARGVE